MIPNAEGIAELVGHGVAVSLIVLGTAWRYVLPVVREWRSPPPNGGEPYKSAGVKLDEVHRGVQAIASEQQGMRGEIRELRGDLHEVRRDVNVLREDVDVMKRGNGPAMGKTRS